MILQQQDVPGAGHRGRLIVAAAASQLLQAHARAAVTIHVPRAVEHLAQRIDALSRDHLLAGMPLARTAERGRHGLEQHAEIARPGIGRGQGRRLAQQRVVGIELLRRRLASTDADREGEEREQRATGGAAARRAATRTVLRDTSLIDQIQRMPSRLVATSMRITTAPRTRTRSPMPPL